MAEQRGQCRSGFSPLSALIYRTTIRAISGFKNKYNTKEKAQPKLRF